jgi:hypothetical protein
MRHPFVVVAALATLAGGCHRAAVPEALAELAPGQRPCLLDSSGENVSGWQAIAADGFSLCAPPQWTVESNRIRFRDAVIRWRSDQPAGEVLGKSTGPGTTGATIGRGLIGTEASEVVEVVGGQKVRLWRYRLRTKYQTGAKWEASALALVGEATDAKTASLEFTIYRTVRLSSP